MNTPARRRLSLIAFAAAALAAGSAHADLVLLGPVDFGGTGLGAVNTILTIQSPANSSVESGKVSYNGSTDVITGSTALTGASQTLTRTLGALGVSSASSLAVVFNAAEPGNGSNGITLNTLTFSAYTPTGIDIFDASIAAPISFADTFTGTGNSGFVFGLSAAQAASFTAAVNASGFGFSALRAGLSASASDATGGNETFFIANVAAPVASIPEPHEYAMLLAGLAAIGFVAWRRVKRSA